MIDTIVDQAVTHNTGCIISFSTVEDGRETTLCNQSLEEWRWFTLLVKSWSSFDSIFEKVGVLNLNDDVPGIGKKESLNCVDDVFT
jgi:hypothetical protein